MVCSLCVWVSELANNHTFCYTAVRVYISMYLRSPGPEFSFHLSLWVVRDMPDILYATSSLRKVSAKLSNSYLWPVTLVWIQQPCCKLTTHFLLPSSMEPVKEPAEHDFRTLWLSELLNLETRLYTYGPKKVCVIIINSDTGLVQITNWCNDSLHRCKKIESPG